MRRASVAAAAAALLLAAPAAHAGPFGHVRVGAGTQHGRFSGSYSARSFSVSRGRLSALGRLVGVVTDARYPSPQHVDDASQTLPVAVAPARTCSGAARIALGPQLADLFGLYGAIRRVRLTVVAPASDRSLARTLCQLGRDAAAPRPDAAALARLLETVRRSDATVR